MTRNLVAALALFLLAPSSPGWGLQLSELLSNCRTSLRDASTDTNFQRFTDAQLTGFLNDGQNQINNVVQPLIGSYSFDLAAGVQEYGLPNDFKAVYRLTVASQRIAGTGYNALDANYTNWTLTTSTPTYYYIAPYSTTTARIGFYAKPKVTTTGGTAQLFYFQNPGPLAVSTDVPFNGRRNLYPYHDLLMDFCAMRGWAVQNRADLAKIYADLFTQGVTSMKNDVNFMPDYNPSAQGYRGPPSQNQ